MSEDGALELPGHGAAVQFVTDAFGHLKAIGRSSGAQPLLERAGILQDAGVTDLGLNFVDPAKRRFLDREPKVCATPMKELSPL